MKIQVCTWKVCSDRFSEYIITRLKNDKERFNLDSLIIEECMCLGKCGDWPNISVDNDVRTHINPSKASEIAMKKNNNNNNNKKKK